MIQLLDKLGFFWW